MSALGRLLQETLDSGGVASVVELARQNRGPIVEPADDPDQRAVTFVFTDRKTTYERVSLHCPALPDCVGHLRPIGGGVFAGTFLVPAAARVKYRFFPDPPGDAGRAAIEALVGEPSAARVDRFNPLLDVVHVPELGLRVFESVLSMPDARPSAWIEQRPDVPAGSVTELTVPSAALRGERAVTVYRPPGHDAGSRPLPLVVLLDGQHRWWRAASLFDNLLADGAAQPFIGVSIGGPRFSARARELTGDPRLVAFVVEELLPLLERRLPVAGCGHVAAGFSLGAVAAAHLALRAPRRFSRLVAVSGGYHVTARGAAPSPRLVEEYERSAGPLPERVYLAAGTLDARRDADIVAQGVRLAGVLRERGVEVRLDVDPTDHDTISARAHLSEGLAWV